MIFVDKFHVSKAAFPFSATTVCAWILQQALENPVLAEAVLLLGALTRTAVLFSGRAGARELNRSVRDLFLLRSRIVNSLQHLLQSPSGLRDESTIVLITIVFCVEVSGNGVFETTKLRINPRQRELIQMPWKRIWSV